MNPQSCPIVSNPHGGWDVLGHNEHLQVLTQPELFSSVVSAYPSIPNGMDPPEHTTYRRLITKYFEPARMDRFEPICRRLAENRWDGLSLERPVELMTELARPYALDLGCAFAGWPDSLRAPLQQWLMENQQATREKDRERLKKLAARFQDLVETQLESRRAQDPELTGSDVTTHLMRETVDGRRLSGGEITSILRNWTVGELATMASSVGILAGFLAEKPAICNRLRQDPEKIPYAIEEVLRLQAPLWSNRRVVTSRTELGGKVLQPGDRLTLRWGAANRDGRVFERPGEFREDRDQGQNLLYGAGIHVCPGAPLARLELRVMVEVMLDRTANLTLAETPGVLAEPPATGWSSLWLRLEPK